MEYVSNISEVVGRLKVNLENIAKPEQVLDQITRSIAYNIYAANQKRVYTQGQDVDGGKIGVYSTKPILVGAKSFLKKSSVQNVFSKNSRKSNKWVTVKGHRLMVLPGGYKQIRQIEGFPTEAVNLARSRKMFRDFSIEKVGRDWLIGFPANYNATLTYYDMVDYFRGKYNKKIWGISKSDERMVNDTSQRMLSEVLKK